jgi:hypothetical protein
LKNSAKGSEKRAALSGAGQERGDPCEANPSKAFLTGLNNANMINKTNIQYRETDIGPKKYLEI